MIAASGEMRMNWVRPVGLVAQPTNAANTSPVISLVSLLRVVRCRCAFGWANTPTSSFVTHSLVKRLAKTSAGGYGISHSLGLRARDVSRDLTQRLR